MPAAVVSTPHAHLPTGHMARTSQDVSPRSTYPNPIADAQERDRRNNSTPIVVAEGPAPQAQQQQQHQQSQAQQTQQVQQQQAQQAQQDPSPNSKRTSPNALRPGPPKIVVKKEPPASPEHAHMQKHRPRRLDLSNSTTRIQGPATAAPTLGMQDVGIACLSPGFQTQDPIMREQLQRSISVRDSQRALIESRLQKSTHTPGGKAGERGPHDDHHDLPGPGGLRAPPVGKKKGPPPGLSIVAPAAHQFAHDHRAIQSAPLGQTFTGRDQPHPALHLRQPNGAPHMSNTSHIHQVPPPQSGNRLPPIGDVVGPMGVSGHPRSSPPPGQPGGGPQARPGMYHSHSSAALSTQRPPGHAAYPASPGFPPPPPSSSSSQQLVPNGPPAPMSARSRDYRSAEDAIAELTQGDKEKQPKYVHYGGHQPPTPPSPQPGQQQGQTPTKHATYPQNQLPPQYAQAGPPAPYPPPPASAGFLGQPSSLGRRRGRSEYERDNGSPPLGSGPSPRGHRGAEYAHQFASGYGPFGAGRDSPTTQKQKKDEFMQCVAKAWDLWHS